MCSFTPLFSAGNAIQCFVRNWACPPPTASSFSCEFGPVSRLDSPGNVEGLAYCLFRNRSWLPWSPAGRGRGPCARVPPRSSHGSALSTPSTSWRSEAQKPVLDCVLLNRSWFGGSAVGTWSWAPYYSISQTASFSFIGAASWTESSPRADCAASRWTACFARESWSIAAFRWRGLALAGFQISSGIGCLRPGHSRRAWCLGCLGGGPWGIGWSALFPAWNRARFAVVASASGCSLFELTIVVALGFCNHLVLIVHI